MISLAELLKSTRQQQKHDVYVVFETSYAYQYGRARNKGKIILHLGRGSILKGSFVSMCHHGIAKFDANLPLGDWEILNIQQILKDPRYKRGLFCKRCLQAIGQ